MSIEVYYFSGTGNSLWVAKQIAEKTNAKLISIPSVMEKERVTPAANTVGVVFPVYYATNDSGIPLIIHRFIQKLENLHSKYIFAVCTCGSMSGTTIENLAKLVKSQNGELSAGFTLKMNDKTIPQEKQEKMLAKQKQKINEIYAYISAKKIGRLESRGIMRKIVMAPLLYLAIKPAFSRRYRRLSNSTHLPFRELVPLADKSYKVNEKCISCGTCAKVCPVDNIKLMAGKPVWLHHCETCLACYVWCPKEAICGEIVSYNEWYHHPNVKLSEMLIEK